MSGYGQKNDFEFSKLSDLPSIEGQKDHPCLAGFYLGANADVLILAGGANFPDKLQWEGGVKIFHDNIFVLKKKAGGDYEWEISSAKLPFPSGYRGLIPTSVGLFCFGGNNADSCTSETWFINYNNERGKIKISSGPKLPIPLTNFAFTKVNNTIYVAGGISQPGGESTKAFFALELNNNLKNW